MRIPFALLSFLATTIIHAHPPQPTHVSFNAPNISDFNNINERQDDAGGFARQFEIKVQAVNKDVSSATTSFFACSATWGPPCGPICCATWQHCAYWGQCGSGAITTSNPSVTIVTDTSISLPPPKTVTSISTGRTTTATITSTISNPSNTNTASSGATDTARKSAMVGGVVGGVLGAALLLCCWSSRRAARRHERELDAARIRRARSRSRHERKLAAARNRRAGSHSRHERELAAARNRRARSHSRHERELTAAVHRVPRSLSASMFSITTVDSDASQPYVFFRRDSNGHIRTVYSRPAYIGSDDDIRSVVQAEFVERPHWRWIRNSETGDFERIWHVRMPD